MKPAWIRALVLCAFGVSQYVRAEEPDIASPRWVIIATVIDRTTGKPILRTQLTGRQLEFGSAAECKFILQRIHPAPDEHLATILKCSKVASPAEIV
jgi:hypothetical protein